MSGAIVHSRDPFEAFRPVLKWKMSIPAYILIVKSIGSLANSRIHFISALQQYCSALRVEFDDCV